MVRLLPCGDAGLLADLDDPRLVLALAEHAADLDDVLEVVPAARTVLLVLRDPRVAGQVGEQVRAWAADARPTEHDAGDDVVLDVRYDGPDLADTADELGLDVDGLVRAHSDAHYVVAFCGFAPGFGYLAGLPDELHMPRLAEPRTRVPAGSVGIAGEFTGVYPRASPGGWRLIGSTDAVLWDLDRDPPALLAPGTGVRFRAV